MVFQILFPCFQTKTFINSQLTSVLNTMHAENMLILEWTIVAVVAALIICVPMTIWFGVESHQMAQNIREKMRELATEQHKTDLLLYQMLPKSIANELKAGNQIMPQSYTEATVYFSDVKGFTSLSSKSTVKQVSVWLNICQIIL
jgi:hypothetical protein